MVRKMMTALMIFTMVLFGMIPLAVTGIMAENPFTKQKHRKHKTKPARVVNIIKKHEQKQIEAFQRGKRINEKDGHHYVKMVVPFIRGPTVL